jgi:hypothetical protein
MCRHAVLLPALQASAAASNSYHILQYKYVPDILDKRGPYREQHLAGASAMAERNKLVMAGALAEPVDGAVFIFRRVVGRKLSLRGYMPVLFLTATCLTA